jgi:hypothetical protein
MDDRNFATMLGYGGDNQQAPNPGGLGQSLYGTMFGGRLPTPITQGGPGYTPDKNNAPIYSSAGVSRNMNQAGLGMMGAIAPGTQQGYNDNPGRMDNMLGETMRLGHAGGIDRGAAAFLGGGYNPWGRENDGIDGNGTVRNQNLGDLFNTARGLGMDTSKYSSELGGRDIRGNAMGSGGPNAFDLYNDLNSHTKDYLSVGGLSQGWAGNGRGGATRTVYKEEDGRLLPVTRPMHRQETKDNGFISRDAIAGLSMMLPMFGGWAGMLGSGAAGTLTAGGGLGLTSGLSGAIGTGATNALVNAGIAGLSGGGARGALTSLGMAGAGAGMSSLTGGSGLSNLFNTSGAGQAMSVNPMSYYQSGLRSAGLGGSPLGQGMQGLQGARSLANLFGRA